MASMRVQRIFLHVIVDGRGSWRVGGLASGGFGERALLVLSLFQLEQYNKQDGMVQQARFASRTRRGNDLCTNSTGLLLVTLTLNLPCTAEGYGDWPAWRVCCIITSRRIQANVNSLLRQSGSIKMGSNLYESC